MQKGIKKISLLSLLFLIVGFIGAFLGKSFERTMLGQKIEKKLGLKSFELKQIKTADGVNCVNQGEKSDDALFVGCNGFF
jgi:hypothetical protein